MTKNKNLQIAEKTLAIIEKGEYTVGGNTVIVRDEIKASVTASFTIQPDEWNTLQEKAAGMESNWNTQYEIKSCTTLAAIEEEKGNGKIGILNFASAKNPGGGFLGGAQAQEESLARSSSLYASLTKDTTMYSFNKHRSTFLYSDYMIYSPDVLFWANDEGEFFENPILADVITSPAPNKGAMLQHKRQQELDQLEEVFRNRTEKVLALALVQKIDCLILGAWGCGVFRNDPELVVALFHEALENKYKGKFKKIVFAVRDKAEGQSKFLLFKEQFIKSLA